ncbi:MAG: dienelactone hydrolase family protein [Bdellovibrionaceae bacterium]|nr:dienelactone hydrolase family protein [Pseudobdellovibrionaceae bacterium]
MKAIHTESLNINIAEHNFKSYLAYPTNTDKPVPGILVIPEFWGLTKYIQSRAKQLAELGYCALAIDIYGEAWIAQDVNSASLAMNKLLKNLEEGSNHILLQLEELKKLKQTDETKIAVMGYCLGGALALHLARIGTNIKGVVSFHGDLDPRTSLQPGQIKAKILVCHGADDSMIPEEKVINFKKEMDTAGADYKFISYKGALHSFTNPKATEKGDKFNLPIAYNKEADDSSWKDMQNFFTQIFS